MLFSYILKALIVSCHFPSTFFLCLCFLSCCFMRNKLIDYYFCKGTWTWSWFWIKVRNTSILDLVLSPVTIINRGWWFVSFHTILHSYGYNYRYTKANQRRNDFQMSATSVNWWLHFFILQMSRFNRKFRILIFLDNVFHIVDSNNERNQLHEENEVNWIGTALYTVKES